eukprot:CAMPEP_0181360884 /NCGR_PEP_ID=MMETSP1106-20121128/6948_1 /TAXON_ID=81844 /ORGANISM="Mantoniella antarctica, Strain SL-175" /LENGTH=209 /DNA_ID=CAMNT_0023474275 /DNA_START=78 /DNA_END=704 /DNA_ORIENTATION=+
MELHETEVKVPAPVTAETVVHSLREVIKFLFFVRQQMPCSYDDLKSSLLAAVGAEALGLPATEEVGADSRVEVQGAEGARAAPAPAARPRATSRERLAVKFFRELDALLGCLTPELLQTLRPTEVALFFGSSSLRPREIFSFALEQLPAPYATHCSVPSAERVVANAARRVIRECIPTVASCPPAASAMTAFLMVKAPCRALSDSGAGA